MDWNDSDADSIHGKLKKICCAQNCTYLCTIHFLTSTLKDQVIDKLPSDKSGTVAKILAEICKYDECREYLYDEGILGSLISNLNDTKEELLIQSCRALANLCYDVEKASNFIVTSGGLDAVLSLLKSPPSEIIGRSKLLKSALIGLLLNIIVDNKQCYAKVMSSGVLLTLLLSELEAKNITILSQHIITILVTFAESVPMEEVFSLPVCEAAVRILEISDDASFFISAVSFLDEGTVPDSVKHRLVQVGFFDLLMRRLEDRPETGSEEDDATNEMIGRVMCDLLTGDEAMNYIYDRDHSNLLTRLNSWLSSRRYSLMHTSALCIGNIARTDAHSKEIVSRGIHKTAASLLLLDSADMKLQHAVLGTLRNLSIPKENKTKIVNDDILDILLPFLKLDIAEGAHVIFKLVGTWRQLVDGEPVTAETLGKDEKLIEKLVLWSDAASCPWVSSEALRLLCSLTIVSRSSIVATNVLTAKGFAEVTNLLTSQHVIMQMEAVNALAIAGAIFKNDSCDFERQLVDAAIGEKICLLIQTPGLNIQLIENLVTMLDVLAKYGDLKSHLQSTNVLKVLEIEINSNVKYDLLKPKVANLKNLLHS